MRLAFLEKDGTYMDGTHMHIDLCYDCAAPMAKGFERDNLVEVVENVFYGGSGGGQAKWMAAEAKERFITEAAMVEGLTGVDVPHPPYHYEEYDCAICGERLDADSNTNNWSD